MVYTFDMLVGILLVIMMTNDQALVQGLYIYQAHPKHGYYQIIHLY